MLNANSPNARLRVSISCSFHIASLWGDSLLFSIKLIFLLVFFFLFPGISVSLNMFLWSLFYKFFPPTFSPTFLTFWETPLSRLLCLNIWASSSGDVALRSRLYPYPKLTSVKSCLCAKHFTLSTLNKPKQNNQNICNPLPISEQA